MKQPYQISKLVNTHLIYFSHKVHYKVHNIAPYAVDLLNSNYQIGNSFLVTDTKWKQKLNEHPGY